ncbi:phage terminase small subunit [Bacillus paranthracis]|uniref:phage terminase small subunit n=1 Tax=Bacillus paranthracis TaxID=2026186 RepID=UPI00240E3D28|nr:phage terminase small subunit [Bacillus paranthracis]MDG1603874.1 phage terminase small subunit [Bacillus paranthracis]
MTKQKHELAQEDYMQGMKYKDIAEKHDVSVNTVKSWKTRYKWDRKGVHTNNEKVRTQKKTGAPINNKNAVGNSGNKNPKWGNKNAVGHGPPKGNDNAVTHGFFRKHFPEDVADLAAEIMEKNPIDMLWENITIQYTAIIRSQRLMFVNDQEDMTKEIKKEKSSDSGEEVEYEIQFAWDKHATFLNAQSRAMSTLSSLIRDFDKLANIDDERRAKLSLINAQIDKLKADINKEDGEVLKVQIIDDVPLDDDDE